MIRWLIDDGPFGELARIFQPNWAWPAGTLHVVEEVSAAASQDKSGRRAKLLAMKDATGANSILVHPLVVGGPASKMLFDYLRPVAPSARKNLGEDASIAYAAREDTDAVFVAADKGACFLALGELGRGRVASPFELWDDLERRGLVTAAQLRILCDRSQKLSALPGIPDRLRR